LPKARVDTLGDLNLSFRDPSNKLTLTFVVVQSPHRCGYGITIKMGERGICLRCVNCGSRYVFNDQPPFWKSNSSVAHLEMVAIGNPGERKRFARVTLHCLQLSSTDWRRLSGCIWFTMRFPAALMAPLETINFEFPANFAYSLFFFTHNEFTINAVVLSDVMYKSFKLYKLWLFLLYCYIFNELSVTKISNWVFFWKFKNAVAKNKNLCFCVSVRYLIHFILREIDK